ncbi:hypothetical protein HAX54_049057 [Datura stramonium]|uniref:(S)-2-hydroxy-acid oxidase n=1 Tax=Datura stramonium TaxID=4076 RepID=A0ABS8SUY6_DATST|nr:hypothetical protein [Datura stramonium]
MAGEPVNVNEFQELARKALPKMYYDYYTGGAEDQYTLKENIEAFHRIIIRPRILVDEVATARGAAACDVIMGLSYMSTCTVEEVASSCNAVRFFQIYVYKRRDITALMVHRAEKNGFRAIILTADTPRLGRREADIKNKMVAPQLKNFEGLMSTEYVSDKGSNIEAFAAGTFDASLCWKGVLTSEDAIKAIEAGVAGIIVSNHGARQLDYAQLLFLFLKRLVEQLSMGLAAKGSAGVKQVIQMLKNELELTMALSGCCSVDDITRNHVKTDKERSFCRM